MGLEEGEQDEPVKNTKLTEKLDEVIKYIRTKYHNKKFKNEFDKLREERNER